ncbi:MAG: hypothetical protein IJ802_03885, partial [Kiritimatiellae bacterium]|nr:hypothetical protein [Kiritimatiellia bacterium]
MICIDLAIDPATGEAAFSGAPLETIRSIVWYGDELEALPDGMVKPSPANLLMFLSDVRTRKFRQGIFLSETILECAALFRAMSADVASGR